MLQTYRMSEVVPSALVGGELDVLAAAVLGGSQLIRRARVRDWYADGGVPDWHPEKWPQPDRCLQLLRQHRDWHGDRRRHLRNPLQKTQRN